MPTDVPRRRTGQRFYVARWSAAGAAFGALMVLMAWRVAITQAGSVGFGELHATHPTMWLVDLMPTILGLAGGAIGILHLRLSEARARTEQMARQIAAAWTADLHEANVELAKTVEERQRFYAALSHEMRTPLSSIVGYSELADGIAVQPPELGGYVAEIYGSARVLLGMVNDLLDAAKLELEGVSVRIEAVDGNAIAAEVARRLYPLAAQKGLAIETDLTGRSLVRADAGRLRQILTNLVSNAVKYSDSGIVTIRSGETSDGRCYFTVEDQGIGISAADIDRMFLPFTQAKSSEQRNDSTGLGLAISRTLARAMHGDVTATSGGRGKGSVFRLDLQQAGDKPAESRVAVLTGTD